ncbi:MAG: DNA-directed RNA polymerase subunit K [Candidatus Woesearchaeota archaeon]|nr:MAG: DNA-directed RNA polymerase subunit K [Candidatus Woesearchaeota archaeon]
MRLTRFEKARIVGARALQLSMGAPFLIKLSKAELEKIRYDPLKIAEQEFEKGVIPITVDR